MNPYYSSRISDCRGLDDIPQSVDTSKRCLDDRTLRNDTSYLINQNMQNNLTQNINMNNRTYQDNSNNGTFIIQNQNEILEDRAISYINCSFNQPCFKKDNGDDDEEPEQPDSPPQNEREIEVVDNNICLSQQREQDYNQQNRYLDIQNGELNIRQELNPPINFLQNPDREDLDQQIELQSNSQISNVRNNIRNNDNSSLQQNESRNLQQLHYQHQQQYLRRLIQSRLNNQNNQRQLNQNQPLPPLQQNFLAIQQAAHPFNSLNILQQQQLLLQNQAQIQRLQNSINRYSQNAANQRLNNSRQNESAQRYNQNENNFLSMNQRNLQNYHNSLIQQNTILRMNLIRNQIRQLQRDELSDQESVNQNQLENQEQEDQYRQAEQLNEIIRNTRRRMNEQNNRRSNRVNQIQLGGRVQQVIELDEEDKVRAKIVFKKALTHLVILSIFSVFILAVFYLNFLMQGIWLVFFFVFCFFTGNKISIYKNLSEDTQLEDKRMAFFNVVEYFFINILFLMIFLFMRIVSQPITLLLVYSPFVHIIWWLVFTTKTQESMNRHIELLLRIYAVTQCLLFSVQFDSIVNWSWVSIFLPSWILLSSLGFYIFGLTILFLCSLYYCLVGQTDKYQIKGLMWCLMVSIHVVGNSLFFLLGLMDYYQEGNIQTLRYCSAALITGSVISSIYTVACSDDLEIFIALANSESLFSGSHQVHVEGANQRDEENQDNNHDNQSNNSNLEQEMQVPNLAPPNFPLPQNQIKPKKVKIIKTTKQIPSSIPQFLIRFSSTYFMKSDVNKEVAAHLEQIRKDKKNKIDQKQNEEEKKKLSQRNSETKSKQNRPSTISQNNAFEDLNLPKTSQKIEGNMQEDLPQTNKENKQTDRSRHDSKLTSQPSCQQCLVCFDNQPDSVILECGHGGLCNQCALDIWKKTGECYLCRQTISKIVQIDINNNQGKYKQVVAVSNMHEISQDQEIMRLSNFIQENAIQQFQQLENQNEANAQNQILNQLNQVLQNQNAGQDQQVQQQNIEPQIQQQNQEEIQQNNQIQDENQIQNIQPQIQLNNQILQQGQQDFQIQQIELQQDSNINLQQNALIIEQHQISQQVQQNEPQQNEIFLDINQNVESQQDRLQVNQQCQKEDITIIQYDEEDEEIQNPDKRNHYQDTKINKVTLSSYINQQNFQADFSSINLSDYENIQNSITHQKNGNQDDISQQTLSIEQLEKQMEEINKQDNLQNCVSNYPSEVNSIKKPEQSACFSIHEKQKNSQEKNQSQHSSEQSINFEECQKQISEVQLSQQISSQNNNAAQNVPAIINIKRISQLDNKIEHDNEIDEQNLNQHLQLSNQNGIQNNKECQSIQFDQQQNQIVKNKEQILIQSGNGKTISQVDDKQNNSQKNTQVEWDIEETLQSTNRSVQTKLYQSGHYAVFQPKKSDGDVTSCSQSSSDAQKIQILDKYMSKYFNSSPEDQVFCQTKEIFAVNNNKVNLQTNGDKQDEYFIKKQDEIVNYASENKENENNPSDEDPPLIQRIIGIDQKLNNNNNNNLEEQNKVQNFLNDKFIQLDEQHIEQQVSNCTIDKETQLINFDEDCEDD
ncbi:zinc finger, C3HC4 type (RING finger) protein (macronuclear) [Tetrahymena thermophila SB210]|uniref:Zinc finger, C3HC4 type (RING finger) protein n=1 Tax=Tetrahymena thermophila (strain SB210) TaxID=312017 RepID=Q24FU2_TETTS|nr:zinc finger, C3HC4 type (RING finger) protein [Tetrahymena thermophila SB210]EAS06668.2 zinc finger, C3HC4 type (RING finger) protein [Tetrahymena thermophila SB210]|eukprot:XP_001026913.2 zinc finger, C3HC4 type (RING finger) protein [Tetrahymena thermophila SB210]